MLNIAISEEDKEKVKVGRFEHPDVHVQKRLHVLYFKALGYSHKDISLLAGVSYTTIETVLKLYLEEGLPKVCNVTYARPVSALDPHRDAIEQHFRKTPPATIMDACKAIKELTGVERRPTQVRQFLMNLGIRSRRASASSRKLERLSRRKSS